MIQLGDLEPGKKFTANGQGMTITPQTVEVEVVWVDLWDVHYRKQGSPEVHQTPKARFLEIVNR